MAYAEVILPLSLANSFTYIIPVDLEGSVNPGCRVIVHFGVKRYYTAIVTEVHNRQPKSDYEVKEIYALLDASPVLRRPQLRFWEWIASYYLCKLGEVYKAALPSGLKLESETSVIYNPDFIADEQLRKNEQTVLDAFSGLTKLTVSELERITGLRNVLPVVSSLMGRGAVQLNEELKKGFKPKTQTFIRLASTYQNEDSLEEVFKKLKRARKQEVLLISYLDLSHIQNPTFEQEVSRKELLAHSGCSSAILDGLIKKGILNSYEKEVSRLQIQVARLHTLRELSVEQKKAYAEILDSFTTKDVTLLHGVTSSGKTEVYIHLIDQVLKNGKQVLYLLPEIAITTQITERLAKHFGDKLLVYHSRFSDNERVEIWNRLLHNKEPRLILGVRSSLFLPFKDLGLVIVDEEHETSYKQQDPAPRYHARSAAIVLAGMHGGKVLLGSATPSIDSYYNVLTHKYGYVTLKSRYGDCRMPEILTVDIKEQRRKKIMRHELFSPLLIQKISDAIEQNEKVILFQNRRGFAPMMECKSCGYIPHCIHCDVSLTYHKYHNQLVCHYCGYKYQVPVYCPDCQSKEMKLLGFGTEKVEEEINELFPGVVTDRLDFDSARTKTAFERILGDFEEGKTQILIGTQMVSKGLDFSNVNVVGILNADILMNYPDFRAHEKAWQMMVQVSGRAGRRDKRGTVILQTSQPEHPLIGMIRTFNFEEMVKLQLSERSIFRYPPYYRLIAIVLRGRNETSLQEMSKIFAEKLFARLGERVLGPVIPPVTRVQNLYIRKILLKVESTVAISPIRKLLEDIQAQMQEYPPFRQLLLHYDVDPL